MSYSDTVAYGLCLLLLGFLIGYLVGFKMWYGRSNELEEQLKAANKILLELCTPNTPSLEAVTNYLDKWGLK